MAGVIFSATIDNGHYACASIVALEIETDRLREPHFYRSISYCKYFLFLHACTPRVLTP